MLTKSHIFLFICLLGFQIGCKTEQTSATAIDTQPTIQKDISDAEIKKLFLEVERDLNEPNMPKLRTLPKERVIPVIREIKKNGIPTKKDDIPSEIKNEYLKLKSAFFLWELGDERAKNEKYILEKAKVANPERFYEVKYEAIAFVGDFIADGKKEYLPIVFDAVPDSNGAFGTYVWVIMIREIESSPKSFLQYLSKEPLKLRKSVYEMIAHTEEMDSREELEKTISKIKNVTNDKEVEKIAKEFLKEVN